MWSNVVFSVFCRLLNQCFTLFQRELRVWRGTGTESTVAVNTANTKQVKSGIGGLNIANMWHLDIKARLIIILVVLYKWSRVYVCGKHSFIHTHTKHKEHCAQIIPHLSKKNVCKTLWIWRVQPSWWANCLCTLCAQASWFTYIQVRQKYNYDTLKL